MPRPTLLRVALLRVALLVGFGLLGTWSSPAGAAGVCTSADVRIVVVTGAHRLVLCDHAREVAAFSVRLGRGGVGKTAEGDGKTPLGVYPLGEPRKSDSYGTFIPIDSPTRTSGGAASPGATSASTAHTARSAGSARWSTASTPPTAASASPPTAR